MDSPPAKRLKLEQLDEALRPADTASGTLPAELEEDADGEHCSICLQPYDDRTMIPTCSHEFCFECLLIWTGMSLF
ncbi:hypothetical protein C8Q77DRAFT_1126524 [Trametes polyzona]|nr:hypothetical protein C8Q77DRAFT_1126524 [Trametes polyzona]